MIENGMSCLFDTNSTEELTASFNEMLNQMESYLDEYDGFRYTSEDKDFLIIQESLSQYNHTFASSLARFNKDFDWNTGDRDKYAKMIALMMMKEELALTNIKH